MTSYLRLPAISRNAIAFVCESSLWVADRDGHACRRITTGFEEVRSVALSPDGSRVAFTSNAEGHSDVYVCAVKGGEPRRVTFDGVSSAVVGFRGSQRILFRSSRSGPFPNHTRVYEIGVDGSGLTRLPVGRAMHVAFDKSGDRVVIGRNEVDSARWKRYRGGTSGEVWTGSLRTGRYQKLPLEGNPVLPHFVDGRIYFISDASGVGNVWSCDRNGGDIRAHTRYRDFYVRNLAAYGDELIFQRGARLFTLDTTHDRVEEVKPDVRPSGIQLRRRFVDPETHLQELALSRDGRRLVSIVRGKVLVMAAWGGSVRQLGATSGVRYRLPRWLAGDGEILLLSDASGEETPEIFSSATGKRRTAVTLPDARRIRGLFPSPTARAFVATDVAGQVIHVDLRKSRRVRTLAQSATGPVSEVTWSPDGRWIAYVEPAPDGQDDGHLYVVDVARGRATRVTDDELFVHSPTFDPNGRFLFVASERTFNPVWSATSFAASCPVASRLYALPLTADQISPFDARYGDVLEADDKRREEEEREDRRRRTRRPVPRTRIDVDGLADRMVVLPDIPAGSYSDLQSADNRLLFLNHPMRGLLDETNPDMEEECLPALDCFDFKTGKHTTLLDEVRAVQVEGDRTLAWAGPTLYLLDTGEEPPKDPPEGHSRHSGTIDLSRLRIDVVPAEEWRQMFLEAWRLQRDLFWTETMAGVDWEAIKRRYLPLLDRVVTREDLSDLIWELQGELGTSHAFEYGGDYPKNPKVQIGKLGADVSWDGKGYRIDRLLEGDSWDPDVASPLLAPGLDIREGDRIVAIGERPVTADTPPESLLLNAADADVTVSIVTAGRRRRVDVLVHTLGSDRALRYRDWVRRNRAYVTSRSEGTTGYVHVRDMEGSGLAEFFRGFRSQARRKGLIVDVRNNSGGWVSQIVLEHLCRRVIGYERPRYGSPTPYPVNAVRGPIVVLCDEWTASDGDVFCHAFKAYGLGPLVGKRTWGGVVGVSVDDYLADGTVVTQPQYNLYFETIGGNIENRGVDPDIEVDVPPGVELDPQLDRAVEEVRMRLSKSPAIEPWWSRSQKPAPAAARRKKASGKKRSPKRP